MNRTDGQIKKILTAILAIAIVIGRLPAEFIYAKSDDVIGTLQATVELNCGAEEERFVDLFDGACPYTPDDTWIVEADIKAAGLLEGASVGLQLDNQTGIKVLGLSGDRLTDGGNWHFKYTIDKDGSVHTLITAGDAAIVDEVKRGYMFQIFEPQWYAKSGSYEISNVTVYHDLDDERKTLSEIISECRKIDIGIYTEDSADIFVKALENAQAVYADDNSSKPDIINAAAALNEAQCALESVKVTVHIGGGDSNTDAVLYEAVAGEELPIGEIDGKYVVGWNVDGKKVTTFNREDADLLNAQFIDTKMLDIKYQESEIYENNMRDIRFIASVDSLQYQAVGFLFSTKTPHLSLETEGCLKTETKVVYRNLLAGGTATNVLGAGYDAYSRYMYAYEITKVPVDEKSPVYVRAYAKLKDGQIVYGDVRCVMATESDEDKYCSNPITDLFHDQGHVYMTPEEPKAGETMTLRLRALRYNLSSAQLRYSADGGATWTNKDMTFEKYDNTGYYEIWKVDLEVPDAENVYYQFKVSNKAILSTRYFGMDGLDYFSKDAENCWQIVPGHDVPEWAKGALYYSILPDAFYNGNTLNDKQTSGENTYVAWNEVRKDLTDKYGGDLAGITVKLDYIKSLGVDALYMNPINKSYQNAGYGPVRYDEVETSYGNEYDLQILSDAVHESGLKLMGDVVLTFASLNSYYYNKSGYWPVTGVYQNRNSEWYSVFEYDGAWPTPAVQWGGASLNLGTTASKLLLYSGQDAYLLKYAELFDGYRFDCGGNIKGTDDTGVELDHADIVSDIRQSLKGVNSDFYLQSEWDSDEAIWDSRWNLQYNTALAEYAKGNKTPTEMAAAMNAWEQKYARNTALCFINMLSDHDRARINQADDFKYNAAVLLQMTYLGSPSIYYGEEIELLRTGAENVKSAGSFYAMDWDETNWNQERLNFYRATGELRQEFSCVKTGAVNILESNDSKNTLIYGRWDDNGAAITVASQNADTIDVTISVKNCDIMNGTVMTDWYTGEQYIVKDGAVTASVCPGGTVLVTGETSSSYCQSLENEHEQVTLSSEVTYELKKEKVLENAPDDDWTLKARVSGVSDIYLTNAQYAGVICHQDENNYVVVARTCVNGKNVIFLGKSVNGEPVIYGMVDDSNADAEVILQLQRSGAYYSAVYSTDEGATWKNIGRTYSNFCNEMAGLAASNCDASFDEVSFGDGISTNTPYGNGIVEVKYANYSTDNECKYEILSGDWQMVTGGWQQSDSTIFAQMAAANKQFSGLYAEATVDITAGNGWAGLGFGKVAADSGEEDGFYLKMYDNGTLILTRDGKAIARRQLEVSGESAVRLVVQANAGDIYVFAGQEAAPIMELRDTGYKNGYVSFCTNGSKAKFMNFHHGSTGALWNWVSGSGGSSSDSLYTTDTSVSEKQIHTIASLAGYSFTNFVCTARLTVSPVNTELDCASGFLLCASDEKSNYSEGVYVYIDGNGYIKLSVDGVEKGSYELPAGVLAPLIMVVKQNRVYNVYLSTEENPILTYEETFDRSGTLSAYTINGNGTFTNVSVEYLQSVQGYATTETAKSWKKIGTEAFYDDFNDASSIYNYFLRNQNTGQFVLNTQEGVLQCKNSTSWISGATVTDDIYSDFTMKFRVRFDPSAYSLGAIVVGLRKETPNAHYEDAGVSLMIYKDGTVNIYTSSDADEGTKGQTGKAFAEGKWYDVKIVVQDNIYQVFVDETLITTYIDEVSNLREGYIDFISGKRNFSIDNLTIVPRIKLGQPSDDGFGSIN